mmetsp:Transcript_213/g.308  ORF Transcript_213/g.308 Transcript_213/m.308 type:complete len:114 (+) Transcript_213:55-396(+)|eukprot:CAMPEP_0194257876 /NCGR_PEP_ID=MMETSP0158-20130606/40062_1 /TAXON_ID=33649 /ORGANISM="Thalassionema nitzschioides, Strain L26-B" /LENGTH=113 /DNA_ID=CAMNT_0038997061 /DNA_START=43 /DNA_END=384 /DNA_ORIENTATION=-
MSAVCNCLLAGGNTNVVLINFLPQKTQIQRGGSFWGRGACADLVVLGVQYIGGDDSELWTLSHQDEMLTDSLINETDVDKKEERTRSSFVDLHAIYLANNVHPPPLTNETMLE